MNPELQIIDLHLHKIIRRKAEEGDSRVQRLLHEIEECNLLEESKEWGIFLAGLLENTQIANAVNEELEAREELGKKFSATGELLLSTFQAMSLPRLGSGVRQ